MEGVTGWKWLRGVSRKSAGTLGMARAMKAHFQSPVKFKFGIRVPCGLREAVKIDISNGTTHWKEAVDREINRIMEYNTFHVLGISDRPPEGYSFVTLHLVFDVKHDLWRKARLVAGGHMTAPPE